MLKKFLSAQIWHKCIISISNDKIFFIFLFQLLAVFLSNRLNKAVLTPNILQGYGKFW